jgi:hypothetical protein
LEEAIKKIWEDFVKLSNQCEEISNPGIYKILEKWAGDFFDIDEKITLHYPLGCVFDAKTARGFFDIVESVVPYQVYEKFAYMDRPTGAMRIKIRECPFDKDEWAKIGYGEIPIRLVKSFDIEQNDKEVYTVFFSYLNGYPVQENKALVLSTQTHKNKSAPALEHDKEKYSMYGYRPLLVHFIGYGKAEGEDDMSTEGKLQKLNQRLKDWYGNIELMYNGQITMSTDLSMDMPQAGEKISFIGGEFYVSAAEHRWAYKGNPETVLTISRGGVYSEGETEVEEKTINEPERTHVVSVWAQTFEDIAQKYYGSCDRTKIELVINANQPLLEGRAETGGWPTIYSQLWSTKKDAEGKYIPDTLIIPPDPDKAKRTTVATKKMQFYELKYWRHKKTGGGAEWQI